MHRPLWTSLLVAMNDDISKQIYEEDSKSNENLSLKLGLGFSGNLVNPKCKKHLKTRSKSVPYEMSLIREIEI